MAYSRVDAAVIASSQNLRSLPVNIQVVFMTVEDVKASLYLPWYNMEVPEKLTILHGT